MHTYIEDDDYGEYYDVFQRKPQPIDDYNVDENGCRVDRYSPFAISIYDMYEHGVYEIIERISRDLDRLCKSGIAQSYFNPDRVSRDNDYLVTLSYTPDREYEEDSRIVGFAVVSDRYARSNHDDNSLYIDVICSNNELHGKRFPGGKVLLHAITEYARNDGYDAVSLKALSNVVNYYRQFGFRFLRSGETSEQSHIHALAEANKRHRIATPSEANRMLLIERAIKFSREVDEDGVPNLNEEVLQDELRDQLELDETPSYDEIKAYLQQVPSHARDDGAGGLHDLFFALIKGGYADLKNCPGITKRQFVRPEEVRPGVWKKWMTCEEGGFQMRKLLMGGDTDTAAPIIACNRGGRRGKRKAGSKAKTKSGRKGGTRHIRSRSGNHRTRRRNRS